MIASLFVGGGVVDFVLLKRRNLKTRLLYFCSYIQRQQNGVWEPYLNEKDQDGRFHFAIAILGGILSLCRRCLLEVSKAVLQSVIRKVCIFIILWNMFTAGREKSLRCRRLPEWKVSVHVRKRKQ